jgi:hypothetical protein
MSIFVIKSVTQAVPTFSMSCFRLPTGLCHHLNCLLRNFWWGSKEGKRKTCWVAWEDMTKPKYMGGLGFRDFELFNLARNLGSSGVANYAGAKCTECSDPEIY